MTKKQRRRLGKIELKRMRLRILTLKILVGRILEEDFGRHLYTMAPQDEIRLLKLQQMHQKYKVSIRYILNAVLPYWHKKFARVLRHNRGIGVKIATLTGTVSTKILKAEIANDFPDNEHVAEWRWQKRRHVLDKRKQFNEDEFYQSSREHAMKKGPLDYETVEEFVRKYKARIVDEREELDKAMSDKSNRRRHYRDNPWF